MSKEIKICVEKLENLSWKEIQDVQGDFKTILPEDLDKLSNSIVQHQISEPIGVWIDSNNNKICIAGNQRLKAFKNLEDSGFIVPEKIPCFIIEAESRKVALSKLPSLASTFGKVNEIDMYSFLDVEEIEFADIEDTVNLGFSKESNESEDKKEDKGSYEGEEDYIKIQCLKEDKFLFSETLRKVYSHLKSKNKVKFDYQALIYCMDEYIKNNEI